MLSITINCSTIWKTTFLKNSSWSASEMLYQNIPLIIYFDNIYYCWYYILFIEIYGKNTARRHSPFVNFRDTYSTTIIICYTTTIYCSKNWVLAGGFFWGGNFSRGKFFRLTFFLRGFFPVFFPGGCFLGNIFSDTKSNAHT